MDKDEALRKALEALEKLFKRDQRNTCQHEETYRGGAIWEICEGCSMKWADDRGGKPKWKNPPEGDLAHTALTAIKQALAATVQEPVAWRHPENAACVTTDPTAYARGIPLYTALRPEPMALNDFHMDSLIESAIQGHAGTRDAMRWLVRAVEAHHRITKEQA